MRFYNGNQFRSPSDWKITPGMRAKPELTSIQMLYQPPMTFVAAPTSLALRLG